MFSDLYEKYDWSNVQDTILSMKSDDVERALSGTAATVRDFMALLSPAASPYLEEMAQKAYRISRLRFGNTIQLYTPLYISNECTNSCLYCGFNVHNNINRVTLSVDEVYREAEALYNLGFRHLLLLTGEDRRAVSPEYLAEIARQLHGTFASLSIEVYPMKEEEYRLLESAGIDGLTLYQETYKKELYSHLHPSGKKRDFQWRLNGPDRGGQAHLRKVGIGALLGLGPWQGDAFFTGLHAQYLMETYWRSHIQVSFPRIRHAAGEFSPAITVTDRELTQMICATRLFLPDAGIVLSTREDADFRDNVMPLGITMMSAGSRTSPGGYTGLSDAEGQFDITDTRSPAEIAEAIASKGFDPVWKDWDREFLS